jgi:hypothetical protein
MLPVLQGWGVGRRSFIISALLICIVQVRTAVWP